MAEKDFAVGGGKTPRKTKTMKAKRYPTYRPLMYSVDYITPMWENDRGMWSTGIEFVDHYFDVPQEIKGRAVRSSGGEGSSAEASPLPRSSSSTGAQDSRVPPTPQSSPVE